MAFTILSHFQIHSTRTFLAKCGNFHAPFQRVQPSMYVTYTVDLHHANLLAILSQYSAVPSVRPRTWNIYMTVYFIFPVSPSWITPSQSPFSMLSLGFEVGAEVKPIAIIVIKWFTALHQLELCSVPGLIVNSLHLEQLKRLETNKSKSKSFLCSQELSHKMYVHKNKVISFFIFTFVIVTFAHYTKVINVLRSHI